MILRGSVFSEVLDMETGLTVITPSDFPEPGTPRVAYLLHGLSSGHGSWTDYSLLPLYAREYNVVFVMPEVARSYYTDLAAGQRFFTYVSDELPTLAARTFVFSDRREDTAVFGGSMGGYGALKCALTRPERFGVACAFAPGSLYLGEKVEKMRKLGGWAELEAKIGPQRARDYKAMFGAALRVGPECEIAGLAKQAASGPIQPRIYQACGTEDPFYASNIRFRDEAKELGLDLTFEEWPGGHEWTFFNEALRRALRFAYGEGVQRPIEILTLE